MKSALSSFMHYQTKQPKEEFHYVVKSVLMRQTVATETEKTIENGFPIFIPKQEGHLLVGLGFHGKRTVFVLLRWLSRLIAQ